MSTLTLIGLRLRFKFSARLLDDVNTILGSGNISSNLSNRQATFVLVEFAPSARVQLVKEKVVPLIAEAQSLLARSPQHFQLVNSSLPSR